MPAATARRETPAAAATFWAPECADVDAAAPAGCAEARTLELVVWLLLSDRVTEDVTIDADRVTVVTTARLVLDAVTEEEDVSTTALDETAVDVVQLDEAEVEVEAATVEDASAVDVATEEDHALLGVAEEVAGLRKPGQ